MNYFFDTCFYCHKTVFSVPRLHFHLKCLREAIMDTQLKSFTL